MIGEADADTEVAAVLALSGRSGATLCARLA
jgi:hypothetical protein